MYDYLYRYIVYIFVLCRHLEEMESSYASVCSFLISNSYVYTAIEKWFSFPVFWGYCLYLGVPPCRIVTSLYLAAEPCHGRCYDSEQMRRFRLLFFSFFFFLHKWLAPRHVLTGEISFQIRMWMWRLSKATNCRYFSAWLKEKKVLCMLMVFCGGGYCCGVALVVKAMVYCFVTDLDMRDSVHNWSALVSFF